MPRVSGRGYAKLILFGEHFVVYGLPGIASGIDRYVDVEAEKVKDSDDIVFVDKVFNEKVSMKEQPDHIKCKLFKAMFDPEIDLVKKGLKLTISGNATPGAGMGYSAALNVAMARAVSAISNVTWKDDMVNQIAYKGECVSHGTPSGIDNTCATYGTLVWFEKNMSGGKNTMRTFKCGKPLLLVLADTGIKHDTKEAVAAVKKRKEADPARYEKIFAEAKALVTKAKKELQFAGMAELGKLMKQNQKLLVEIGVSCKEIDEIVKLVEVSGATGAKLTGAGMGGNVIILCENAAQQEKMIALMTQRNYKAMKVKVQ